jgi:hypothetical protein
MTRRRPRTQLTTHVSPELATEVGQIASSRGVSISAVVEVLLQEALRAQVEHEHGALLEAVVERTIRLSLADHLGRLGDLGVRATLYGDEARRLIFAVLVREIGIDQARSTRREVHSAAWQRLKDPLEPPAEQQPEQRNDAWPAASGRS